MFGELINKIKIACKVPLNIWLSYFAKQPKVLSIDETIAYILEHHCSVSRFGDGEFSIMFGRYNGFQKADRGLAERLTEVIKSPQSEKHIACIPDCWEKTEFLNDESRKFWHNVLLRRRADYFKLIDRERIYYNAFFTRPYNMFRDKSNSARWFTDIKHIWEDQDILIVEGAKTRLGVGNDLFDGANSIERILCPATNAYDKYDVILEKTKEHGENKLILIALGMTATVLSYDLSNSGCWAIDIGHIDIEYEWFLRQAGDKKIAISGKYVNEVSEGRIVDDSTLTPEYKQQIICDLS